MSARETLPNRRGSEIFDFEHGARQWTACVSRFADGRLGEIFLSATKSGAVGDLAAETAIVASLALQHGCAAETLTHAIAGRESGPLSAALALIEGGVR
jgi:hypothetical protein